MIKHMEMGFIFTWVVRGMKDSGKMIINKALEMNYGLIMQSIKDIIRMEKNKVKENFYGEMDQNSKDNLKIT